MSSAIALAVGATFAFALDRYQFRFKSLIEGVLLSPFFVPHFTVGLGFLILAAQVGLVSTYALVVVCHVILRSSIRTAQRLYFAAQPRSAA